MVLENSCSYIINHRISEVDKMTKEFNLSEKRKETKKFVIDWWFSQEGKMNKKTQKILNFVLDSIKEQDREFIKKLKDKENDIHSCHKGKCKCYNVDIEDMNAIIILKEDLDKLAGKELSK